jgi:hypothetical protein
MLMYKIKPYLVVLFMNDIHKGNENLDLNVCPLGYIIMMTINVWNTQGPCHDIYIIFT